jgi:hypothetical protein
MLEKGISCTVTTNNGTRTIIATADVDLLNVRMIYVLIIIKKLTSYFIKIL